MAADAKAFPVRGLQIVALKQAPAQKRIDAGFLPSRTRG